MLQNIINNLHNDKINIAIVPNRYIEKEVLKKAFNVNVSFFDLFTNLYDEYKSLKIENQKEDIKKENNIDKFMYSFACYNDNMLSLYKYDVVTDFTNKLILDFENLQLFKKYKLKNLKYTKQDILDSFKHTRTSLLPVLHFIARHLDKNIIYGDKIFRVNTKQDFILIKEDTYEFEDFDNIDHHLKEKYKKIESFNKLLTKELKVILGHFEPDRISHNNKLKKSDIIEKLSVFIL